MQVYPSGESRSRNNAAEKQRYEPVTCVFVRGRDSLESEADVNNSVQWVQMMSDSGEKEGQGDNGKRMLWFRLRPGPA